LIKFIDHKTTVVKFLLPSTVIELKSSTSQHATKGEIRTFVPDVEYEIRTTTFFKF
jgi:hypothetical protein